MKRTLIILLIALLLITACKKQEIPRENGSIQVFFCPKDNCEQAMITAISSAQDVKCAFYDLDLVNLTNVLKAKNADILVDEDNYFGFGKNITSIGLMHNKFCILDNKIVTTGSMNPTNNCAYKNNNNLVIIESPTLAKNYLAEFDEIKYAKSSRRTKTTELIYNGFIMHNYFCPEDHCKQNVLNELKTANKSIYFMTFSFTDDDIGDFLIENRKELNIKGIFEKRQNGRGSEYKNMQVYNMNVTLDTNPATMHHKVFIIDNKTVVLGSYNPTQNADTRNDENILIIHDKNITMQFVEEFESLFPQKTKD